MSSAASAVAREHARPQHAGPSRQGRTPLETHATRTRRSRDSSRRRRTRRHGPVFVAVTTPHTGRSPKDKFLWREASSEKDVDWGAVNQPMSEAQFEILLGDVRGYLNGLDDCSCRISTAGPIRRTGCRAATSRPTRRQREFRPQTWLPAGARRALRRSRRNFNDPARARVPGRSRQSTASALPRSSCLPPPRSA